MKIISLEYFHPLLAGFRQIGHENYAHLDSTVKSLDLVIPYKKYPQLKWLQYTITGSKNLKIMISITQHQ